MRTPQVSIKYKNRDITRDIEPYFEGLTLTDEIDAEHSDALDLIVENADGRWVSSWYPQFRDTLTISLGYLDGDLLEMGTYEIDTIETDYPPLRMRIRGLAAGVSTDLRTARSTAYDDKTLDEIARDVADRHGLKIQGEIEQIKLIRVSQVRERDLRFLQRLSRRYGYAFSVKGEDMVFYRLKDLRGESPVRTLALTDMIRCRLTDRAKDAPKGTRVTYHKPEEKKLISYDMDADGNLVALPSADTTRLHHGVDDDGQAEKQGTAAQDDTDILACSGSITVPGDPALRAGGNVAIEGFGHFDGTYQIYRALHDVSRGGGFTTEIEIRRFEAGQGTSSAGSGKAKSGTVSYDLDSSGNLIQVPAGGR